MEHDQVEEDQDGVALPKAISVDHFNDPVFMNASSDDEPVSFGGVGTLEILEVTKLLNGVGLTCCLVGTSALIYFGAGRVRNDWDLCVPTERLNEASTLVVSTETYEIYPPRPPTIWSLLHTFPRFKVRGIAMCFTLIPSDDAHIGCITSNIEHSHSGLPYPRLNIFAQSLLDTNNIIGITDLIDGMDLSEEWGLECLKLDAENDLAWTRQKNEKIRASIPNSSVSCLFELGTKPISLEETWHAIVRDKERRIGAEYPEGYYATRFRGRGTADPRTTERHYV